uniref:polyhydroxyalkanoate depolymerase n=2 Tax=Candidatus Ichthyocystis TaxID=2929841 RepID=UPI000B86C0F2
MFYSAFDFHKSILDSCSVQFGELGHSFSEMGHFFQPANSFVAPLTFLSRLTREYPCAPFDIYEVQIDGRAVEVHEETLFRKPFGNLLNFCKNNFQDHAPMLVLSPMSGHYASLLRRSVRQLIKCYDTYITDWVNPRYIPLAEGDFGFDDFVQYICDFVEYIRNHTGRSPHIIAICQPTAPALVAVHHMSSIGLKVGSMILMGGPVDVRCNPTSVCRFAEQRTLSWFEDNLIVTVPARYPGAFRHVYPGYLQHMSFINMHPDNHIREHFKFYEAMVEGNESFIKRHINFYDSYHAVMDMTAKFFLESIDMVFHRHCLALGEMMFKGKKVDLDELTDVPLLVVEAELDDICAPGQTSAAFGLCSNIPDNLKEYLLVKGAGHYGVFS